MITTDGDHRLEHRQKMETSKAKFYDYTMEQRILWDHDKIFRQQIGTMTIDWDSDNRIIELDNDNRLVQFQQIGTKQQIRTMTIEWDKDNNNRRTADGDHRLGQ